MRKNCHIYFKFVTEKLFSELLQQITEKHLKQLLGISSPVSPCHSSSTIIRLISIEVFCGIPAFAFSILSIIFSAKLYCILLVIHFANNGINAIIECRMCGHKNWYFLINIDFYW